MGHSLLSLALAVTVWRFFVHWKRRQTMDLTWWTTHADLCSEQAAYCLKWAEDQDYPVEARNAWTDSAHDWALGWRAAVRHMEDNYGNPPV